MDGDLGDARPAARARGQRRPRDAADRAVLDQARHAARSCGSAFAPHRDAARAPLARRRGEVLHRRRDRLRHRLAVRARQRGRGHRAVLARPGALPPTPCAFFASRGFQCVTHATGDRAVREALDAYRDAGAAPGVRHRIEHIETLQPHDLPRFAAEGVVASMQPQHMMWLAPDRSDNWSRRLGPERCDRAFPIRSLRESGAACRARLRLAGRALRPARGARRGAAAAAARRARARAVRRPGARRPRRAGGLHDRRRRARSATAPARPLRAGTAPTSRCSRTIRRLRR